MSRPHPPEFRKRAVELARLKEKPIAQIAVDLGISDSCLRNWLHQADIDEGVKEGLSTDERAELVQLLQRAAAPLFDRQRLADRMGATLHALSTSSCITMCPAYGGKATPASSNVWV